MLRYLIASYVLLRGVVSLFEGVVLMTGPAQYSLTALVVSSVLFIGALFFLFAGSGLAMGRFWALKLGLAVLVVDLLWTAGSLVLSPGVLDVVWLLASLLAVVSLVFKEPFRSSDGRPLDEDESVHGLTSSHN